MKQCKKCGIEFPEEDRFCTECGRMLIMLKPGTAKPLHADSKIREMGKQINILNSGLADVKKIEKSIINIKNELKSLKAKASDTKPFPFTQEINKLKKQIKNTNQKLSASRSYKHSESLEALEKKMSRTEKGSTHLKSGFKTLLEYMKHNEGVIEEMEKAITNSFSKEDAKLMRSELMLEKEKSLHTGRILGKAVSDIKSLSRERKAMRNEISVISSKIAKEQKESIKSWDLRMREELKNIRASNIRIADDVNKKMSKSIRSSSRAIDELVRKVNTRMNSHSLEIKKLQDKILRMTHDIDSSSMKKMEEITKRLFMDETVLAKKIEAVLGREKDIVAKTVSRSLKEERDRVEKTRKKLDARLVAELEKIVEMRKESREAVQDEIKRIENLRHSMQDSMEKELTMVKIMKDKARNEMREIRSRLKDIDPEINRKISYLKNYTINAVSSEVDNRLKRFEETAELSQKKIDGLKEIIKSMEKRLGTDIINLTHKTNTLSKIQQRHEIESVSPEKAIREKVNSIIDQEKDGILKSMGNHTGVPHAYSKKELKNIMKQVNELKLKIALMEKEADEKMKGIKEELVREALSDIERAL